MDSKFNYDEARYNQAIHCAMRKYGFDNFDLDVLEVLVDKTQEEVNDCETQWIQKMTSLAPNGYNLKAIGEANRGGNRSSLTIEEQVDIRNRLKHGESIRIVADLYSLSYSYASQINTGERLFSEDEKYPLQKNRTETSAYLTIIELLETTPYPMQKIADTLGLSKDTVQRVNRGEQQVVKTLRKDFPIRKTKKGSYKLNL